MEWKQIAEGIYNSTFIKEAVEEVAKERMDICNECLYNSKNSLNPFIFMFPKYCRECKCNLKWKTHSMSASCPLSKWEAQLESDEESNEIDKITGNE